MNAHSAARVAGMVLLAGLAAGNVGCRHARRVVDACLPPADCTTPCPPDAKVAPKAVVKHAPAPCADSGCAPTPSVVEVRRTPPVHVKVPPQDVEVRETPPVHVKVPQQDVVVNLPPQAAPVPPMAAPVQPMAGGFVSPVAAPGMMPANVTHVPANRARLGFAFDTVRIRLPIIRPIAIPTVPEATFTMPVAPVQPVAAVQPQAFVQPVAAAPVQPVAVQPVAPASFVQPVAAAPVQPQAFVQPIAAQPVQPVAVQPVAPPQMQFVQPVAPQAPQVFVQPVAPQAPQVFVQPQAPVAPQAPSQQATDDYCRQVDALMRALEASKRAAGCPPLNPPAR